MYAFLHIEKTAGSTLNTILRRSFGTRHCDVRLPLAKRRKKHFVRDGCVEAADVKRVRRLYHNLRGIAGHNVRPIADLAAAFPPVRFFTILREPVPRMRSHFLNRGKGHSRDDLLRWLDSPNVHNWQTNRIAGRAGAEKAIEILAMQFGFVGLTERFDETLVMLGQWLGEPTFNGHYRPVNRLGDKRRPRDVARTRHDMSYLESDDVRTAMQQANAEDQKVYDYVVKQIYPRHQAKFVGDLESATLQFQKQNERLGRLREPLSGRVLRNYIYKPLLHCRLV